MLAFLLPYLVSPFTWAALATGLIFGSFLNVCIIRIPEKTFWKDRRSLCPHCGALIPYYLNIPLFSYLFLKGKSQCCQQPISWQYPAVEMVTGIMFVLIYWEFPFVSVVNETLRTDPANFLRFFHAALFTCLIIVCAVIDLRLMIIPDVISLPMVALTPLVVYLHPDLDWKSAGIGVAAGALSLYVVAWLYWLIRREIGIGMGDVKLLAAIGGWLGYQAIMPTIFLGSITGALAGISLMVFKRELSLKSAIPFGPFLGAGAVIHLLWGDFLQEWLFLSSQPD